MLSPIEVGPSIEPLIKKALRKEDIMSKKRTIGTINIPVGAWGPVGWDDAGIKTDLPHLLHAEVYFQGMQFFAKALEVEVGDGIQEATVKSNRQTLEDLFNLTNTDKPFSTTKIKGRNYVVWIEPSS